MKIAISAESTIDMPNELLKKYNIQTTPFTINLGDEALEDGEGASQKIFDYVAQTKTLPKTSAVNEEQYKQHFKKILEDYDAIIHISLSSLMSSAHANATNASKEFKNVYVVDSRTLSTGIALLAMYANELLKKDLTPKEIYSKVQSKAGLVQVSFVLENLQFLYKGGRCSALTLFGANLLKIKPQIIVKDGKMSVGKKFVGNFNNAVTKYCEEVLATHTNPDLENVFITHSSPMPELVESLREKLQKRGFKNIMETLANGTICSHCGPNCIGILFIDKE